MANHRKRDNLCSARRSSPGPWGGAALTRWPTSRGDSRRGSGLRVVDGRRPVEGSLGDTRYSRLPSRRLNQQTPNKSFTIFVNHAAADAYGYPSRLACEVAPSAPSWPPLGALVFLPFGGERALDLRNEIGTHRAQPLAAVVAALLIAGFKVGPGNSLIAAP
jgi:hypothetical protein